MRTKVIVLVCLLAMAALILPLAAQADTVKFIGASGPNVGGVIVAPYQLSVNGGPTINAMCDDFADHVSVGEVWIGTVANFPLNGNFTGGLFGSNAAAYDKAIWLYTQFIANPSNAGGINYAVWALFNSSVTSTSGYSSSGAATWTSNANTWYSGGGASTFDFSGYQIITPTAWGCNSSGQNCTSPAGERPQEYIYRQTPEPGSLLLFGTGLIGIGGFLRRRLRS